MAIQIQRQADGGVSMAATLDQQPEIPAGYRPLAAGETLAAGDLVYDMVLNEWQDAEAVLWLMPMVDALGGWASPVPPCRKEVGGVRE